MNKFQNPEFRKEFGKYYIELLKDNNNSSIREDSKLENLFSLLTTGTLAISVTFLTEVIIKYRLPQTEIYIFSLIALVASLFFQMLGYFSVQKYFKDRGIRIEKWFNGSINAGEIAKFDENSFWGKLTRWLTNIAYILGFAGIFLFSYFGIIAITFLSKP